MIFILDSIIRDLFFSLINVSADSICLQARGDLLVPAEPRGPVGSPACWPLWSCRLRCRVRCLRSCQSANLVICFSCRKPRKATRRHSHVRIEEVVAVDADLQVVLHGSLVDGQVPLDGSLRRDERRDGVTASRGSPGTNDDNKDSLALIGHLAYDIEWSLWAPAADINPEKRNWFLQRVISVPK